MLRKLDQDQNLPWIVCGNFNEIMFSFEKSGGIQKEQGRMEAFRKALEKCQLVDIDYSEVWYTWERGNFSETNIRERLDRGVANKKWINLFPLGSIQHLPNSTLDHCPLLLNTKNGGILTGSLKFKFEAWWTMEESLEREIKGVWGSYTGTLAEKLERLKSLSGKRGTKKKVNKRFGNSTRERKG